MTPEEYDNLKPGDMVDFSELDENDQPPKNKHDGRVLTSTIAVVLATGDTWQSQGILVEVLTGTIISEYFFSFYDLKERTLLGKNAWWIPSSKVKVATLTEVKTVTEVKSVGGNCTICNEFNKWQSGPYQCWKHSH
jgi:hypothetical protein